MLQGMNVPPAPKPADVAAELTGPTAGNEPAGPAEQADTGAHWYQPLKDASMTISLCRATEA